MIQSLSAKYNKDIAFLFSIIFYCFLSLPVFAVNNNSVRINDFVNTTHVATDKQYYNDAETNLSTSSNSFNHVKSDNDDEKFNGGPSQPEMSTFKSVSTDNMVNLFTGDFQYNIPLLDVGGYPINIFYDGGVGVEQEASWVGLGWNINPGNINRNMRGIPDDFNGNDTLVQQQVMKPNKTWGVRAGADFEVTGIKAPIQLNLGGSLGVSFNNYLGPALDLQFKGNATKNILKTVTLNNAGKDTSFLIPSPYTINASLGASLSSRDGASFNGSFGGSFLSKVSKANRQFSTGLSLSTAYNSRSGIKDLHISEQMSFNKTTVKQDTETKEKTAYRSSNGAGMSTSISFSKPSYIPAIKMPVTNSAFFGHFQVGGGISGAFTSVELEIYNQTAEISPENIQQKKPLVGYLYYQLAMNNPNAVMDFTRFNDKEVTPQTPIISAPQYSYDVFSIQGEGTGGTIRPYRNDLGYVRDNLTVSKDKSLGVGADYGIPGHIGANVNIVKTPSTFGAWGKGNKLQTTQQFTHANGAFENVYFRNPGESSVLNEGQFNKVGGTDLVRYKLGGSKSSPTIEPVLQRFNTALGSNGSVTIPSAVFGEKRKKRTQVINFLTAEEASMAGLEYNIKSYKTGAILDQFNTLNFESIPRVSSYRKQHHISEITVTESNGRRYIYGIPVYNIIQKDFTFSVDQQMIEDDKVAVTDTGYLKTSSSLLNKNSSRDGYVQVTETPAYAHSFLLSGLLSPDYVDVLGDGISDDDLGDAVKFNYTRIKAANQWAIHKWRTPLSNDNKANFNSGNLSEVKDDKGIVSYGERESWYPHSIESKTMIALFYLENREDGKGPTNEYGGINTQDSSLKRLKRIDLFSKADLKLNGLTKARPIKSVHFKYSYTLCQGTPDNITGGGKLTLDSIYFTYNGQNKANKNKYVFAYTNAGVGNPNYEQNASDRWGNYKPKAMNPANLRNSEFPYACQDNAQKTTIDNNAAAWAIKKILLPSGGQIEIGYESDDYAFVQNRRAAIMMQIVGFGKTNTSYSNQLYSVDPVGFAEHDYVFIKVPETCNSANDVYQKYLKGIDQFAFKLLVKMPKGDEYINVFANLENTTAYGVFNAETIWIKLKRVDGISPLSLTALEFLRQQLPGQAFEGYDVSESAGIAQVGQMLLAMMTNLKNAFKSPVKAFREAGKAKRVIVEKSFVRLNDPDGFKYGGGQRVKNITLRDNWQAMTGQYNSVYGQQYEYTTTESFNGAIRKISSGVASYEPSIGGEENPFNTIVQIANKLPLGPSSYGSVEMPVLDAFFPAASVGYSKVTVRTINNLNADTSKKTRSGIGKQVTEYFTAKDYPVIYSHTPIDPESDKSSQAASFSAFFYKYAFDSRAISQGFLVVTNDMHGKMKSQSSYAENDENTKINYTEHFYRNTGAKGLDEKFDFVYADSAGIIKPGNIGVDIELMTDTREYAVKANSFEVQAQWDLFPVFLPIWLPFIWPVINTSENIYRAVTTTKVISYHSVLDSIVVIDKGSQVSTRNLVFDAETGEVVVNRTNNEFNQAVYSTNYPAYWGYKGMGLAYQNINAEFTNLNFYDGKITSGNIDTSILQTGDELLIVSSGTSTNGCIPPSFSSGYKIWALDRNKSTVSTTSTARDIIFVDRSGKLFTKNNVNLRIIRSGYRNLLAEKLAGITSMHSPVKTVSGIKKIKIDYDSKVVNANAVEFKEVWQTDQGVISKASLAYNYNCTYEDVLNCNGDYLEKTINPYRKGLLGNFKPHRSMVFFGNRKEANPLVPTDIAYNGYLDSFKLYWDFNAQGQFLPDISNNKWVWNSQLKRINARGLELETKDALNIYTAAQYGYKKTMPVAIVNNARYQEIMYEGFEDYHYGMGNNGTWDNCEKRHVDFFADSVGNTNQADYSNLVNTDTTAITAHTGKYVLRAKPNTVIEKLIKVKSTDNYDFNFPALKDTTKVLANPGGFYDPIEVFPSNIQLTVIDSSFYSVAGFRFEVLHPDAPTNSVDFGYKITTHQYLNIPQTGDYTFKIQGFYDYTTLDTDFDGIYAIFTFKDTAGNIIAGGNSITTINYISSEQSIVVNNLCAGICEMEVQIIRTHVPDIPNLGFEEIDLHPGTENWFQGNDLFTLTCINTDRMPSAYRNLQKQDGCIYTLPISGKEIMSNPSFALPANQQMLFSAWVKEDCGDIGNGVPCTSTTYTNNKIFFDFGNNDTATLIPSGPIIDGWQLYEAKVIVPANVTTASLKLINSSTNKNVYFDDIRLHPYQANMKSYVYDPVNLRLVAELDENNYAVFYEYDEEGTLIRNKVETKEGIKTIKETRSAKQKIIMQLQ